MNKYYVRFESGWRAIVDAEDLSAAQVVAIRKMRTDSMYTDAAISRIRVATPQDEYNVTHLGRRPQE